MNSTESHKEGPEMRLSANQILLVLTLILIGLIISNSVNAQIENVIVEKYYISDANDATDTTQGRSVAAGSVTYRVFVDLAPDSKIKKIYGDANHTLKITSTTDFYNNIDRPDKNFGYLLNKSWLDDNPTIALDSWLTIGLGLTAYTGVPKSSDTDGTFIGGLLNNGGTAAIPGGILVNNDPDAGEPLTSKDGYIPNTQVYGQWLDIGFKDSFGDDTTVFGPLTIGSTFTSNVAILQQNSGVQGPDNDNIVLVGQFTTTGELSFELNVEIEQFDGTGSTIVKYVADGSVLMPDEVISPFLRYPTLCGCTDPQYLEYSPNYACNIQDSCVTPIVFGCLDSLACNFDPSANFNIQELCCYPGYCNDRDLELVCPSLSNGRISIKGIYPVPAADHLNVTMVAIPNHELYVSIMDATGRIVFNENTGIHDGLVSFTKDLSGLPSGIYLIRVSAGDQAVTKTFTVE